MLDNITINVERSLGKWIVRVNGIFIEEFWSERKARRIAMNIAKATRGITK